MASPQSTLPNDEKEAQDSAYNPGEQSYREGIGAGYTGAGTDQAEAFANDPANHDSAEGIRKAEEDSSGAGGGWKSNVVGKDKTSSTRLQNLRGFVKKRGALFAILGILGIGGGVAGVVLGPTSMLVNLMENITTSNDSSSTSLERRFMKVFGSATNSDSICTSSKIKCKMGKISNKALNQLRDKGITPNFGPGTTNSDKKIGYPSKNPTSYTIGTDTVEANGLTEYLTKNPKIAAKVLGTGGAFNLRLKAWAGKYITKKFLNPFNLKKDGGLADGKNTGTTAKERMSNTLKKLRAVIPGADKLSSILGDGPTGVKAKATKQLEKSKKGGVGYTTMVAGCIAVKAPGYIAAGVAAVQLAQLLPIVNSVILSPGSKIKASGVDTANAVTSEDVSTIGSLLTDKTPRSSDGKLSSALDSPILLSAMGVNKGKPAISKDFTPGYAALTNQFVVNSNNVTKETKTACNAIMSPAAMYSAASVDAAVTIASAGTIIGGVLKVVGSFAISELVTIVTTELLSGAAQQVITDVASNDKIATATGQDLGDVLGVSSLAFFSAGGMARGLPALKQSQVAGYVALQQQSEDFQRQMDVASLSPFDTSSRYTFLGSIVHNYSMASLANGSYDSGIFSQILGFLKTPLASLSTNAGATPNFSADSCGYAADFGLETTDPGNTPAINAAGLPCTGITAEQSDMSVDTALTLIQNEGWLDETKDISDNATIDDLISSGYIKPGTPLTDFIESCSNASSGDYLFNSAGCTVNSTIKDPNSATAGFANNSFGDDPVTAGLKDPRSLAAISVFLLDFQSLQALNGEDDSNTGAATTIDSSAPQNWYWLAA